MQKQADGSYTIRTTEMDENGEEVEVIKTVHPNEGALVTYQEGGQI